MQVWTLSARIDEFALPAGVVTRAAVAIPTVKATWSLKYGEHAYYFMNFRTRRGVRVRIRHRDLIRPGWERFRAAAAKRGKPRSLLRALSSRYAYGFSLLEQIMLMTVPHTVTALGAGRFVVSLWSWFGYALVDVNAGTVAYHTPDPSGEDCVRGSRQWLDPATGALYAMSFSLDDSLARIDDPFRPVAFRIFKHKPGEAGADTVWTGRLADSMHDILLNKTGQYCVACELGMHVDGNNELIPSKVLIVDLVHQREWVLDRFSVAAHACFDPEEPNTVYFSNHNFEFRHSSLYRLLRTGGYSVKFHGPASVFKYELTPAGPREVGVFTRNDFYRLTNLHVFTHRGSKVMAAMGFPDEIFLVDAKTMRFLRKIRVEDPVSWKHFYVRKPALIGTVAPSPDGEKLFVRTSGSFQIVDVSTGTRDFVRDDFFCHASFNHMVVAEDTSWDGEGGAST